MGEVCLSRGHRGSLKGGVPVGHWEGPSGIFEGFLEGTWGLGKGPYGVPGGSLGVGKGSLEGGPGGPWEPGVPLGSLEDPGVPWWGT